MKKWTSFPGVVSTAISWQRRAGSRASNPLSVRHFFFFLRLSPRPPVTNGVAFRLSRHRRVRQQFQHLEIEKALVRHRFGGDAGPVTKASGLFPCCDVDVTRRPPKNQRSFRKKKHQIIFVSGTFQSRCQSASCRGSDRLPHVFRLFPRNTPCRTQLEEKSIHCVSVRQKEIQ